MNNNLDTADDLFKYYNKIKYLVLFPDKKFKFPSVWMMLYCSTEA